MNRQSCYCIADDRFWRRSAVIGRMSVDHPMMTVLPAESTSRWRMYPQLQDVSSSHTLEQQEERDSRTLLTTTAYIKVQGVARRHRVERRHDRAWSGFRRTSIFGKCVASATRRVRSPSHQLCPHLTSSYCSPVIFISLNYQTNYNSENGASIQIRGQIIQI